MAPLALPGPVLNALDAGAALAVSVSGGKDSQALLVACVAAHRAHGWPGRIVAVHADLGRAEWGETPAHVERTAAQAGVELVVVRRAGGDLVARIEERAAKLAGTGKPVWPSAVNRYCTSDLKRGPINTFLRTLGPCVVSAEGVRADESRARAAKPAAEPRREITTRARTAWTWRAILDWTEADVWEAVGVTTADLHRRRRLYAAGSEAAALDGWPAHPAYIYGNSRLSCAICVLGSRADVANGARHNPALLARYVEIQQASGTTFRADLDLADLAALDRQTTLSL